MVKQEMQLKNIHGIQVERKTPVISHLLFIDDSLLFARANSKEADNIMKTLKKYQDSSY